MVAQVTNQVMSDFYLKYFDLVSQSEVKTLLDAVVFDETSQEYNLMSTKENIEDIANESETILLSTRVSIMGYLYFVWLEGISNGPPGWWCEMLPQIKELVVIGTCLESLGRKVSGRPKTMEIAQVLIRLWDYIETQEKNNNWSYIMEEYDELCRKHNDLRELYFL